MLSDEEYKNTTLAMLHNDEERTKYFLGHFPRFAKQKAMFEKYLNFDPAARVLDCGTSFPFASWYLNELFECSVWYTCIDIGTSEVSLKVKGYFSNVIFDEIPREYYDLVICTEMLEHLACNLYPIRDKLIAAVKPGGYLLVSYPLRGENAKDYDKDIPGYDFNKSNTLHVREFTMETAEGFIALPVIEKHIVFTEAYRGNIYQFLYRKLWPGS